MTEKKTLLSEINDEKDLNKTIISEENMEKCIMDLSLTLEERIEALKLFYEKRGDNDTLEIINKLGMMYEMSGTKMLREYLYKICENNITSPFLQSIAAKSLYYHNRKDELSYDAVSYIYPRFGTDLSSVYRIDIIKILMNSDKHKEKALEYFLDITNDSKLDSKFRYKTILQLENSESEEEKEKMKYFLRRSLCEYSIQEYNQPEYRILSCQNILQHQNPSEEEVKKLSSVLLSFSKNESLPYNLRANATDELLRLGDTDSKTEAKSIIMDLARAGGVVKSVYDNAQNVHNVEVEKSVKECLEFLHTFNIQKIDGKEITYDYVKNTILNLVEEGNEETKDRVNLALNRIELDRALYSEMHCTLSHALLRIWTYIVGHKDADEMKKRMVQELCEMADTCSSGFISRLCNVISGFGDFSIRISWRDQIIANLNGRLNKRIRDMDDLKMQENVLSEMTIKSSEYQDRCNFLEFFRNNVLSIREEMHLEFREYISDTDFDLYFRNAVDMYESGNFM